MPDHLEAERFSPLGSEPIVAIDLSGPAASDRARELAARTQAILIGIDRAGVLPDVAPDAFDCLLTVAPDPPRPWVHTAKPQRWFASAAARVGIAPIAAATCMRVLRVNEHLPPANALAVESMAYSTLLGGNEFRRWRAASPTPHPAPAIDGPPVRVQREGDRIILMLARPDTRNAMTAAMRDALWEALAAVLDDPSEPTLILRGDGACFSTGGDLAEFGTATDLAAAHAIRTARSCAALLIALGERAEVYLHGACVGSGIEVPAAAARRRAIAGAFFQLPELGMGLMPGAGGTVTIPRAIGRHRTAALVLGGGRLPAAVAYAWGLVHSMDARR